MATDEERIALFLDYENLAIGARDSLGGAFDLKPISDALAERGRVVVRKAYADWSAFDDDRRMLTKNHVELIEITQRMGAVRKNAADIKLAVDALELAFEREYLTTFVIGTGDSDFTPLVHKLRELNKKVIGVGVKNSTSALLPPACDEFLFYDRLEGVEPAQARRQKKKTSASDQADEPAIADGSGDLDSLSALVTATVGGLKRTSGGAVLASSVKRALLRKDPTFNEADYGFRAFGELMRHLENANVIELSEGSAKGDPEVGFPTHGRGEDEAFAVLQTVVADLEQKNESPVLSGLKNQVRKRIPDFTEKRFGYGGFLQFAKAARAKGLIDLEWDDDKGDYVLRVASVLPE
ncbi:MAG: NYN domain-containing protein [Acidimicrobiia bacterium]|nr:NYN domain-containing protein [Acidimicrobiia bacterium]NNF64233.1 NYN domain-containing protein [Acidimicrobiia bacterium]